MNNTLSMRHILVSAVVFLSVLGAQPARAQQATLDTAVTSAGQWAALGDPAQAVRMWSVSSPIMQGNVTKEAWTQYMAKIQGIVGTPQNRVWTQIARVSNPQGLPPGDYLNIIFITRFSKLAAEEKVSLAPSGAQWIPVGYVVTPLDNQAPTAANTPPAAVKTAAAKPAGTK